MDAQTTPGAKPAPSGLDALAANIAAIDGAGTPTPDQQKERDAAARREAEQKALDADAREWAQIPFMLGGVIVQIAPELRQCYAEDACMAWGKSAALVAKKYGWKGTAMPELSLAICTLSMVVPSFFVVREKLRMLAAAKDAGPLGKFALWWQQRKAAKAAPAVAPEAAGEGAK